MAFSGWIRETWDRVVASDPGLHRLRMALSAGAAMATTLGLEYGYARLTHAGAAGILVAMLLGTVVAMIGSTALAGPRAWPKVRTAVFFPIAIGAGTLPGVAVAGHADLTLITLVAVMFVAVYIRRFGQPCFFYGFMIWIGYFFAAFLRARWSDVPSLLADVSVGSAWVLLLSVTVLRTHPRRTLHRVLRAFDARARAVARVCADLLVAGPADDRRRVRLRRKLHSRQLRLAETALIVEGWSAEPDALPRGWSAPMLRRRLLDAHLAVDEFAAAAESLILADGGVTEEAARIAGHLARREDRAAERRSRTLLTPDRVESEDNGGENARIQDFHAQQLATAALEFIELAARTDTPPGVDDTEEFSPAVTLAFGVLPGSGAVAGGVAARGRWSPLSGMSLTTRQAIQVAVAGTLAIIAGRELSQARYYWAVIATFIAFTGTATRSEVSIKAGNRVLGTVLGFGAGLGLVHLTAGHMLWMLTVIVAGMSCGFYLVSVSYAGMIFFVTIMVSQLYSALHEYSAGLIVLRLEETAIGAAIGIAVALLVLPTSTRDTVEAASRRYFSALADVSRAIAVRLSDERADGAPGTRDLDALTRTLDVRLQQLALVARPLTRSLGRSLILRNDPGLARHRITLYAAVTRQIRGSALAARRSPSDAPEVAALSQKYGALADVAAALAETPARSGHLALGAAQTLLAAADAVPWPQQPTDAGGALAVVARPLTRLWHLLDELDVMPPGAASPVARGNKNTDAVSPACSVAGGTDC
jgi:hypothetical protein